ncbi:hypothetical protein H9635_07715 [Solibacillus sp. A46]|uniref:Uncharacterized protein n=1 Tax=Solibacillus faecavium TaxID=2762221 RepID=A0ABR8XXG4_9BACL|nr:hypothetical protein [Solibacillus faecavium]MBD8036625.1 hypothetical protein [Solibacillus faecavium]
MLSSLIFFFLGFGYSYFFYKNAQKTYEITVMSDGSFDDENFQYYYIWNSGKETIYKEDLLNDSRCLEIKVKDKNFVEFAKISDVTSDYFRLDLHQENEMVKVDFDLLRPDEGFTLMMKTKINSNSYWNLQIKQKKNIFVFPTVIKARGLESNLNLIINVLSFLILGFLMYSALIKIDYTNLENGSEYIQLISPIIYIGAFLIMLPTIIKRIKAPRPPIELELHFVKRNIEQQKMKNVLKRLWRKKWTRRLR